MYTSSTDPGCGYGILSLSNFHRFHGIGWYSLTLYWAYNSRSYYYSGWLIIIWSLFNVCRCALVIYEFTMFVTLEQGYIDKNGRIKQNSIISTEINL